MEAEHGTLHAGVYTMHASVAEQLKAGCMCLQSNIGAGGCMIKSPSFRGLRPTPLHG